MMPPANTGFTHVAAIPQTAMALHKITQDGIEYHLYFADGGSGKALTVVNHTKELMEVELLRLKLEFRNLH